jgi:DNA-binding beta-propeller fold protein YncE
MKSLVAYMVLVAVFAAPVVVTGQTADADAFQQRVVVTAIAYDDGFGSLLKTPSGITFDAHSGEVFVADAGNGRVVVYDRELNSKFTFLHYVEDMLTGRKMLGQPKSIAVSKVGDIILIDGLSDVIDRLDFRGRLIEQIRPAKLLGDSTLKLRPMCITSDEECRRYYVLITGDLTRVIALDEELRLVSQMGEKGTRPHQFDSPTALAVHGGKVYIGDLRATPAVKIFDTSGAYLLGFGDHDIDRKDLSFPVGFAFLADGAGGEYILVTDALRQVTKVYHPNGEFFTAIGGIGVGPGLVQYPAGCATESPTTFYVVERTGERVQRYEIK